MIRDDGSGIFFISRELHPRTITCPVYLFAAHPFDSGMDLLMIEQYVPYFGKETDNQLFPVKSISHFLQTPLRKRVALPMMRRGSLFSFFRLHASVLASWHLQRFASSICPEQHFSHLHTKNCSSSCQAAC